MQRLTEHEIEKLLEHGSWVRNLALSLAGDFERGEELEQRAWEITLKQPAGRIHDPKNWFGKVLRNLGIMQWREDQRRSIREQAVAETAHALEEDSWRSRTPDGIQEKVETARILTDRMARLEEPLQSALYLRFVEDLKVREVALRLSIPESTAHYRISQGIARLKEQMRDKLGPDWRAPCLALAGPIPVSIHPPLIATLFMSTTAKIAFPVLLLSAAGFLLLSAEDEDSVPVAPMTLEVAQVIPTEVHEEGLSSFGISRSEGGGIFREGSKGFNISGVLEQQEDFKVRAVDAHELEPIQGADLFLLTQEQVEEAKHLHPDWSIWGWERRFEAASEVYPSQEAGLVSLPGFPTTAYLGGRFEGRFGSLELTREDLANPEPLDLLLERLPQQEVQVVDESGAPVEGVVVGYSPFIPDVSGVPTSFARTDTQGHATLRNLLPSRTVNSIIPNGNTVALLTPTRGDTFAGIATEDLGKEVVILRMPPTSEVEINCSWRNGGALPDGTEVFIQQTGGDPNHRPSTALGARSAFLEEGRVSFPGAEVGMEIDVKVYSEVTRGFLSATAWVSGDNTERSILSVEFQLPDMVRSLRLTDAEGNPVSNTEVYLRTRYPHEADEHGRTSSYQSWKPITDATGWLAFDASRPSERGGTVLPLVISGHGEDEHSGWIRLAPLDLADRQETGEPLPLTVSDRFLAGAIVQDSQGNPVTGEAISLKLCEPGAVPPMPGFGVPSIGYVIANSDANGRVRFHGSAEAVGKEIHLAYRTTQSQIDSWVHATPEGGLPLGTEDFVITLPTTYRVEGRVLLDDPEWYMDLEAQGRYPTLEPGRNRYGPTSFLDHRNGSFSITLEEPEDLFVELTQYKASLVLDTIPLPADWQQASDGVIQLPTLDLRGNLYRHTLEIQIPDGVEIPYFHLVDPDTGVKRMSRPGYEVLRFSKSPSMKLRIEGEGIKTQVVTLAGTTQVLLEVD